MIGAAIHDRLGNELTGSAADVEAFERAVDAQLRLADEAVDAWTEAGEELDFPLGTIGAAYFSCLSSEGPDAAAAATSLATIDPAGLTERERRHLAAASAYASGDLDGARDLLGSLSVDHPRDVLALLVGHQLDFFRGDAMTLRDRIGRSLLAWDRDDSWFGFLRGMHAFGLEECGAYEAAEEAALDALERDERDVWALHAAVHTHEMRGATAVGLALLDRHRKNWSAGNLFVVHNAWHEALFLLDRGDIDRLLASYDTTIHGPDASDIALELLDATALLWRLHLDRVEVGPRWEPVADAWEAKDPTPWYAFNDMHATMAFVGAGRLDEARRRVALLEEYLASDSTSAADVPTNVAMTAEVGLPVCTAMLAFGEERYDEVVDVLHPVRTVVQHFGGSHAQRDVVARTLLEAAVRGGRLRLAEALVSERLANNPSSTYNQHQLERLRERAADDSAS